MKTETTATIINSVTTLTIADRNKTFLADATSGAFNINLPDAATVGNKYRVWIKKIDTTDFAVTIVDPGIKTMDIRSC